MIDTEIHIFQNTLFFDILNYWYLRKEMCHFNLISSFQSLNNRFLINQFVDEIINSTLNH